VIVVIVIVLLRYLNDLNDLILVMLCIICTDDYYLFVLYSHLSAESNGYRGTADKLSVVRTLYDYEKYI
jgi:hypothetical protein